MESFTCTRSRLSLGSSLACSFIGRLDVLRHREGGKESAVLKQHPPAGLHAAGRACSQLGDVLTEDFDTAGARLVQAYDRAHQHGLSGARTADDSHDLAALHGKIQLVMDDLAAELILEAADPG